MFKFIRNHADKIQHVDLYPIIGLIVFVAFFIFMLVYVKKMSKEQVDEVSSLPLDIQEPQQPLNR